MADLFMLANKMGYEDTDLSLETLDGIFEYSTLRKETDILEEEIDP